MFVDLDWPLNASSLLSASAELLVELLLLLSLSWSANIWCGKIQRHKPYAKTIQIYCYGIIALVQVQRNFSTSNRCKNIYEYLFAKNEINDVFMIVCFTPVNKQKMLMNIKVCLIMLSKRCWWYYYQLYSLGGSADAGGSEKTSGAKTTQLSADERLNWII